MSITNTMTPEKMQDIYTNDSFCKTVANAHKCYDQNRNFKHFKTCDYPIDHIITETQILEAKTQLEKRIKEDKEKYKNSIIFTNMGIIRKDLTNHNFIESHRIRAYFLNSKNEKFMIEAILHNEDDNSFYFDYSIKLETKQGEEIEIHNYKNLCKEPGSYQTKFIANYTKSNLLRIINNDFDCNFSSLETSSIIFCDHISQSPKLTNKN